MQYKPENPLIVQSDMTMLLEVDSPLYEEVRDAIAPFAEIIKSPEHVHSYRITPISLWNAASSGLKPDTVKDRLKRFSRFEVPHNLINEIENLMKRFGKIHIEKGDDNILILHSSDPLLAEQFSHTPDIVSLLLERTSPTTYTFYPINRGVLKQALLKAGYPAVDMAGYKPGAPLDCTIREGHGFSLRQYQIMARDAFHKGGSLIGGNGVVALPSGSGKTVVGMAVMSLLKTYTLILTTGITAIRQWRREILDKTNIRNEDIGEYSGQVKEIKPVTITTYQILTSRKSRADEFVHFNTLNEHPWGLIIYDEVHLLPARVFRFTASLQAVRRLGLTATLIREDGREGDVFSLIGPKCFDIPWKVVEKQGFIAQADCCEIRVGISRTTRTKYAASQMRQRFRIASENPAKIPVIKKLTEMHKGSKILIIGQYLEQLDLLREELNVQLITGKTPQSERDKLFHDFRDGGLSLLIVSSVANFAIDLPDASVAIQVSGKFGSRQEEAQRLGRILRPKSDNRHALFYTIVTADTEEQDFALKRQLFLTEQGYSYLIVDEDDLSCPPVSEGQASSFSLRGGLLLSDYEKWS